jgi:uncharacterized protein (DUF1778 family)
MATEQTTIKIRLPKWRKAKIQRAAELAGESMSAFLLIAVDAEIERQRAAVDQLKSRAG